MKKWPESLGVMLEFWYSQQRFTDTNWREFIRYASKIAHEWNPGVHLEIFSLHQAIEILGYFYFSEQIFYRNQSLGVPVKALSNDFSTELT